MIQAQITENPVAWGATGLRNSSCLAADSSENTHSQSAPREVIAALRWDFSAEALRVAAIKSAHAADNASLGDDGGAERDIRLVISHLRAGSAAFRELQNSIDRCPRVSGKDAR